MKRIAIVLLAVALLVLAACAPAQPPSETETTTTTVYEIPNDTIPMPPVTHLPLYVANEAANGWEVIQLDVTDMIMPGSPPQELVQLLVQHGALPQGSQVQSLEQVHEGLFTLDMNQAFAQGIGQLGSTGEWLMLGSLVNTMLAWFDGIDTLYITIDGQLLETGHNVYDEPLSHFTMD